MTILDFPSSPTVGQQYTAPNGAVYTWDGAVWKVSGVISTGTAAGGDLSGTYPNPTLKLAPLSTSAYARVSRSTTQSIPNITMTPISFDTVVTNQGGLWTAGTPDRLTIKQAGFYVFGGSGYFTASTGGLRRLFQLLVNGSAYAVVEGPPGASATASFPGAAIVTGALLAVNDYVQCAVFQDSGGALNLNTGPNPNLWVCYVV